MATPPLPLDTAPDARLFRMICDRLEADPQIKRVVKSLKTWRDSPADRIPVGEDLGLLPLMEVHPAGSPERWKFEDETEADLIVVVSLTVAGLRAENVMNLWNAVKVCLRPPTDPACREWEDALQAAGASSAPILMGAPAYDLQPNPNIGGVWTAVGQMKLTYRTRLFE